MQHTVKTKLLKVLTDKGNNEVIDLESNSINGFPDIVANGIVRFNYNGIFCPNDYCKYVGEFYTDNFGDIKGITDYDNVVDGLIVWLTNATLAS